MERPGTKLSVSSAAPDRTMRFSLRRRVGALLAVVLVGTVGGGRRSGAAAQDGTPADPQEIEATVQRYYDAYNAGNVDALDDVLAPDWVDLPPQPGSGTDIENFKAVLLGSRSAFPDLFFATQDFIVEGNQVAVRSTATGTHEGTFLGVAGTGKPIEFHTIDIHRVEAGRIVETHHVEDLLGVLIQIGGFSPAAGPAAGTPAP
jgi:steroid delta-isomerase-like uncharacterized protein